MFAQVGMRVDMESLGDVVPARPGACGAAWLREVQRNLSAILADPDVCDVAVGGGAHPTAPQEVQEAEAAYLEQAATAWVQHLRNLVTIEWEEEQRIVRERLTEWPLERLVAEGLTMYGLSAQMCGEDEIGRLRIRFAPEGCGLLPAHDFQHGDQLLVSWGGHPLDCKLTAQVLDVTGESITCTMRSAPPPCGPGQLRLDRGPNSIAHARTMKALVCLESGHLQDEVRRVLLELDVDGNNTVPPRHFDLSGSSLNDAQKAAVSALERRRVALIQGPPGCGKTHLACAILKAAYRGRPLLAVADSNVAADELLRGLLSRGVRAVRAGTASRITGEELVTSSVEAHAAGRFAIEGLPALVQEVASLRQMLRAADEVPFRNSGDPASLTPLSDATSYQEILHLAAEPVFLDSLAADVVQKLRSSSGKVLEAEAKAYKELSHKEIRAMLADALLEAELRLRNKLREATFSSRRAVGDLYDAAEVVCSTITGCGSQAFADRTFELILMDEASQATEPRALIAISRLAKEGRLVLVGDQQQLPPVCLSRRAKTLGLGFSLFDRLLRYPSMLPALLNLQYRMHPLLSRWPSETFYGGRLLDGITGLQRPPVPGFNWPAAGCLAFVEAAGPEEVSPDGCSRVNREESALICSIVSQLVRYMPPQDMGVISPYRAQVRLLAGELSGTGGLEVRTVDGYQGREKALIIISCVRSNPEGKLGFLADPRRLNVALTRAKRGLIVVGNSATLRCDKHWRSWLQFVQGHNLTVRNLEEAARPTAAARATAPPVQPPAAEDMLSAPAQGTQQFDGDAERAAAALMASLDKQLHRVCTVPPLRPVQGFMVCG